MITGIASNSLTFSFDTPTSYNSNELVRYLVLKSEDFLDAEWIDVTYNGETIRINLITECRYNPVEIHFQNKHGAQQALTFFKSETSRINIDSQNFESDRGQPLFGNHQFVDYNKNGRTSFKVNSGFVDESINDDFKQLLLSERVWRLEGSLFVPLNIKTSSLEYKSRQKDRLINYEIEFEYSFNDINTL